MDPQVLTVIYHYFWKKHVQSMYIFIMKLWAVLISSRHPDLSELWKQATTNKLQSRLATSWQFTPSLDFPLLICSQNISSLSLAAEVLYVRGTFRMHQNFCGLQVLPLDVIPYISDNFYTLGFALEWHSFIHLVCYKVYTANLFLSRYHEKKK